MGWLFLQVRADPAKDPLVSDVPLLRSRPGGRVSSRPHYFHLVEDLPRVSKRISDQGWEGRKKPQVANIVACTLAIRLKGSAKKPRTEKGTRLTGPEHGEWGTTLQRSKFATMAGQ